MKCYAVITAVGTAFFRARANALLFARACDDGNSRLEVQEKTEQQLPAFILYDCTECINLPVAWLPSRDIQVYCQRLFEICMHREYSCMGLKEADIFKISTIDFMDYMGSRKPAVSPQDVIQAFIEKQNEMESGVDMNSAF